MKKKKDYTKIQIARLLKSYRKRNKLNQGQLAEKIGIHRENIVRWEKAYHYPNWTFIDILKKAGVLIK